MEVTNRGLEIRGQQVREINPPEIKAVMVEEVRARLRKTKVLIREEINPLRIRAEITGMLQEVTLLKDRIKAILRMVRLAGLNLEAISHSSVRALVKRWRMQV
jgi:hypothetical protein